MEKNKIPEGWIARTSTTYPDRVYYFNVNTGKSSWDLPKVTTNKVIGNTGKHSVELPKVTTKQVPTNTDQKKKAAESKSNSSGKSKQLNDVKGKINEDKSNTSGKTKQLNDVKGKRKFCDQNKPSHVYEKRKVDDQRTNRQGDKSSVDSDDNRSSKRLRVSVKDEKRNVVKTLQKEALRKDRAVKKKRGKKLIVEILPDKKTLPPKGRDETLKEKPLFKFENEGPTSLVSNSGGQHTQFNNSSNVKLSNVQSWVDNLQQGWGSPGLEFNSSRGISIQSLNNLTDSGYLSPPVKRGWPGTFKSSAITERDIIDMEIETWQLPEVDTTRVEEEMDVDIGELITEVRQLVKGKKAKAKAKKTWEPAFHDHPVLKNVVIVLDTNILISHLGLVEKLKEYNIPDVGSPMLFIPWMVLQELDCIKDNYKGKHKNVQIKAMKAIWLLKSWFSKKSPNVRGQTPRQEDEAAKLFDAKCNDDSVLQACLQCQKIYDHCEVILLTNDNNVIVKSMVSGATACSSTEILEKLNDIKPKITKVTESTSTSKPDCDKIRITVPASRPTISMTSIPSLMSVPVTPPIMPSCPSMMSMPSIPSPMSVPVSLPIAPHSRHPNLSTVSSQPLLGTSKTSDILCSRQSLPNTRKTYQSDTSCDKRTRSLSENEIPVQRPKQGQCMADTLLREEQSYTMETLCDDIHGKLVSVLKEGFGKVLEEEMKLVYDDIWLQIVLKKPPWSFIDILQCWKKHWMAVFGMVLRRCLSANVERLLCYFQSNRPRSIKFMFDICKDSLEILKECVKRNRYGETMFGIKECVLCMYELCEGLIDSSLTLQSVSSLNDYLRSKLVPASSVCGTPSSPSSSQEDTGNRSLPSLGNHGLTQNSPGRYSVHSPHQSVNSHLSSQMPYSENSVIDMGGNKHGPNGVNISQSPYSANIPIHVHSDSPVTNCASPIQGNDQNVFPTHQVFYTNSVSDTPDTIHNRLNTMSPQPSHIPTPRRESIAQSTSPAHFTDQSIAQSTSPTHFPDQSIGYSPQQADQLTIQGLNNECMHSGASDTSESRAESGTETPGDRLAGELIQGIWEYIFAVCNKLADEVSQGNTENVNKLLHLIVPVAKDLRVTFVKLLEFPVPELSSHETEFTIFADLCNNFFNRCGEQVTVKTPVLPFHYLMLFSNQSHRETLGKFHGRLDDMLRHLYHCMQVIMPDD